MSLEAIGDAWERSSDIKSSTDLIEEVTDGKMKVSDQVYQDILARHDNNLESVREVFIEKLKKASEILQEAEAYEYLIYVKNNKEDYLGGPVSEASNSIHQLLQTLEK